MDSGVEFIAVDNPHANEDIHACERGIGAAGGARQRDRKAIKDMG